MLRITHSGALPLTEIRAESIEEVPLKFHVAKQAGAGNSASIAGRCER